MDVCGSLRKQSPTETPRPPSVLAEKNNALNSVSSRRPRIREVSSRYKSPSQSMASSTRRCPSPNLTRTIPSHTQLGSKRALSAERKRPSRPPSPPSPSTPVHESSVDSTQLSSRKLSGGGGGGRLPESLWPSTMRSLSVSFQSDTISIPVSKKEKPVTNIALDRTLRPPLNVAHKHGEMHSALSRKPTPERKRSPLKGKNAPVQSENSKPVDSIQTRLIDQQRWPSRIGEQVSANSLAKSVDPVDDTVRNSGTSGQGIGIPSLRRSSLDGLTRPLQKSSSDATSRLLTFDEISRVGSVPKPVDDSSPRVTGPCKLTSLGLSERSTSATAAVKSQSLPSSRSQPASLSRTSVLSSARGVSPSRARPSTPPRGISPSRIRSSTTSQSSSSASVLSFIADFKRGKKSTNYIDDAHHLRLLYNRYLQWRFINARAETALYVQKIVAEETFYNVWDTTLNLWDSVISKRINLQQLNLDLKLNAVLNDQMAYLEDWASIERDHIGSLAGVVEDLEASTCRVPITGGARADIESLKAAVCSAVDLMQSMGYSECSLPSRLEGMNSLVSELLVVAEQGKAMLAECEALLASTAAMQVGEYSLRTHLLQQKQALEKGY